MEVIGITKVREKGVGWLHELAVRTDRGVAVLTDDTNEREAYGTAPDVLTPAEVAAVFVDFDFGGSRFPARPVPKGLPSANLALSQFGPNGGNAVHKLG